MHLEYTPLHTPTGYDLICYNSIFKKIGFTPCGQPRWGMGLQDKEVQKN